MPEKMKAAVMRGLDNMVVIETEKPCAHPGNVVVALEYVGICGSDVHYYHSGRCGSYEVNLEEDFMLGHECAGTVCEVGEGVESLKVGDRVCLDHLKAGRMTFLPAGGNEYIRADESGMTLRIGEDRLLFSSDRTRDLVLYRMPGSAAKGR